MKYSKLMDLKRYLVQFWNDHEWPHPYLSLDDYKKIINRVDGQLNYMELICAAAIKLSDGRIFIGMRHDECYKDILRAEIAERAVILRKNCVQGFMTNRCKFLNRKEAYKFAIETGQLIEEYEEGNVLVSEDLW